MTYRFLKTLDTPGVRAAREANGTDGRLGATDADRSAERFTGNEIASSRSATVSIWRAFPRPAGPTCTHRGGPPGFLRVLDGSTLGFADFRGNRQYLSLGNVARDDRVALFLIDYARRGRLKILARMTAHDLKVEAELAARLATPGYGLSPSANSPFRCTPSIGTARGTSRLASPRPRSKPPLRRCGSASGTWKTRMRACAPERSPLA